LVNLGYYIIGIFIASWAVSVLIYKLRGIDRLDHDLPGAPTSRPVNAGE
jgi:high-affinity nickel-transport protein